MIINHNMSAMYANRNLGLRDVATQDSIEKLSSGQRINRAGDDAAGLAVSEKMRSQIRGLNQASRNIGDAISFIQTSEGYLQNTSDVLGRLRELAVQSANGIYTAEDRAQIQVEVTQLVDEVNRVAEQGHFNNLYMFQNGQEVDAEGFAGQSFSFHVGANIDENEVAFVRNIDAEVLSLVDAASGNAISFDTAQSANQGIETIDGAIELVNRQRADLGAYQNRFEIAQKGVDIAAENLQAAESRIRDADMASEIVEFTKNQILTQANTAMLAQANVQSQSVLQLL